MKIALASDHGGFLLKSHLKKYLESFLYSLIDLGVEDVASVDYPLFAQRLSLLVQKKEVDFGVLVCSTGVGVSIAANRFQGVRAVNCQDEYTAKMSREHNNANVICFGEKIVTGFSAERFLDIFLKTSFSLEARHLKRVLNIDEF